jgi:hypothetical protein
MNQRSPTRTILAVIIASALVISASGLTAIHKLTHIGGYHKRIKEIQQERY